jgi:hypothetical protein
VTSVSLRWQFAGSVKVRSSLHVSVPGAMRQYPSWLVLPSLGTFP